MTNRDSDWFIKFNFEWWAFCKTHKISERLKYALSRWAVYYYKGDAIIIDDLLNNFEHYKPSILESKGIGIKTYNDLRNAISESIKREPVEYELPVE